MARAVVLRAAFVVHSTFGVQSVVQFRFGVHAVVHSTFGVQSTVTAVSAD
jgi:hypothetical protein